MITKRGSKDTTDLGDQEDRNNLRSLRRSPKVPKAPKKLQVAAVHQDKAAVLSLVTSAHSGLRVCGHSIYKLSEEVKRILGERTIKS